jgi:hypothetical protein
LVADSVPKDEQNLDFITNQYALEVGVTHGDGTEPIGLRINGSGDDAFTAVGILSGSNPLSLSEEQLDGIAGGPLGDWGGLRRG